MARGLHSIVGVIAWLILAQPTDAAAPSVGSVSFASSGAPAAQTIPHRSRPTPQLPVTRRPRKRSNALKDRPRISPWPTGARP